MGWISSHAVTPEIPPRAKGRRGDGFCVDMADANGLRIYVVDLVKVSGNVDGCSRV